MRQAADELRAELAGETVTFVVNRNINVSNVCTVGCAFCGFGQGKRSPDAYEHDERRVRAPRRARRSTTARPRSASSRASTPTGRSRTTWAGCASPRTTRAGQICTCTPTARWRSRTCATSRACRRPRCSRGCATPASTRRRAPRPRCCTTACASASRPNKLPVARWVEIIEACHRAGLRSTVDGDVRPHRGAVGAGRAHARGARAAGAHGRHHRVRAAVVHPVPDAARPHARRSRRSPARRTSSTPPSSGSRSGARSPTCRRAG